MLDPIFRSRPALEVGMPVLRAICCFTFVIPNARFQENGEAGIVIGDNNQSQLIFVQNDKVNAKDFDGIESVHGSSPAHDEYYTTDGIKVNHPRTGLYIVKSKNGKTRKVIK